MHCARHLHWPLPIGYLIAPQRRMHLDRDEGCHENLIDFVESLYHGSYIIVI